MHFFGRFAVWLCGVAAFGLSAKPLDVESLMKARAVLSESVSLRNQGQTQRADRLHEEYASIVKAALPPNSALEITEACPLRMRQQSLAEDVIFFFAELSCVPALVDGVREVPVLRFKFTYAPAGSRLGISLMKTAGEQLTNSAVVEIVQANMMRHEAPLNNSGLVAGYTEARIAGSIRLHVQTALSTGSPRGEGAILSAVLSTARPVP